jgi:hypothetical protein
MWTRLCRLRLGLAAPSGAPRKLENIGTLHADDTVDNLATARGTVSIVLRHRSLPNCRIPFRMLTRSNSVSAIMIG